MIVGLCGAIRFCPQPQWGSTIQNETGEKSDLLEEDAGSPLEIGGSSPSELATSMNSGS